MKEDYKDMPTVPTESYPCHSFSQKQLPELAKARVGQKVTLVLEGVVSRVALEGKETRTTVEFHAGQVQMSEKDKRNDFVNFLAKEAERAKEGDYSEDITRPAALSSKAHKFNQQLNTD